MAKITREINKGDTFNAEYDGTKYQLRAVEHEDRQAFKIIVPKGFENKKAKQLAPGIFGSVSAAAGAVIGPEKNVNGYKFWGVDPVEEPAEKPAKAKAKSGEGKAAAPKAKGTAKAAPKAKAKAKASTKAKAKVEDEDEDEEDEDFEMEFDEDEDEDEDE